MINIHILGNGTAMYAIRSLLEVNALHFSDEIKVNCFGDYYFTNTAIYALNNHLTVEDVIKASDIVICTDPEFEHDDIVDICSLNSKPLFCTFALENKIPVDGIVLDNLNVNHAATDLWISRLLDVVNGLEKIVHYHGVSKLHNVDPGALPGITAEEYREATEEITGQPNLIYLEDKYFYSSEMDTKKINGVTVSTNWLFDSDKIDAKKIDIQTEFIYHTVCYTTVNDETYLKHSHMKCPNSRSLAAWHYINACVVCSFVYMWDNRNIPKSCTDYNVIDHSTFTDNIFGARFRIA